MINGSKAFITNSGTDITELVTVTAVTGTRPDGGKEISAILVPVGDAGLHRRPAVLQGRLERLGHPRAVVHRRAGCPAENLVGERGRGYAQFLSILDEGRIAIAALAAGLAQGCVDESVKYAGAARGVRPADRPATRRSQFMIADMEVRAHTARLAYYRRRREDAARRAVQARGRDRQAVLLGDRVDNARDAAQVHGGYGFMNEFPVGRFYRDAKILEIGEGTSEVQRMLIARTPRRRLTPAGQFLVPLADGRFCA